MRKFMKGCAITALIFILLGLILGVSGSLGNGSTHFSPGEILSACLLYTSKELVSYVYQTIYHKRKLFIEAPTGVGKTISTIFPTVKAMGKDMGCLLYTSRCV